MPGATNLKLRRGFIISLDGCMRYLGPAGHGFSFTDVESCSNYSRERQERMCEEERKMRAQDDLESDQIRRVHDLFRHLRQYWLVLPHTFIGIIKHERFGERHQQRLFLPTGSCDSASFEGATLLDFSRLWTFIKTTYNLLSNDDNKESAKFTASDFTFITIPANAVFEPVFNDSELKELIKAGPEALELYGISVREFIDPYRV
ncbi:hypothetical protein V8D89_003389 [Ganoderma adspersum]